LEHIGNKLERHGQALAKAYGNQKTALGKETKKHLANFKYCVTFATAT